MSKDPQPRDEHGHFKANHSCNCKQDISKVDVAAIIRELNGFNAPQSPVSHDISIAEPVKIKMDLDLDDSIGIDIWHHSDNPVEDTFLKVAAGVLLTVLTTAVLMWMYMRAF
jgi:hypothetical protein